MELIAHRGYWKKPEEKNSIAAFERALNLGYGIETDLRDCDGQLVIAHDPPRSATQPQSWSDFLTLYQRCCQQTGRWTTIATNIKADGLADVAWQAIPAEIRQHFFFFDMSVPDALAYLRLGARVFSRHSEIETVPAYYSKAHGIWMDEFSETWIDGSSMQKHTEAGKQICLVSPELQKRPHLETWQCWKKIWDAWPIEKRNQVMLCTDFPEDAGRFFGF